MRPTAEVLLFQRQQPSPSWLSWCPVSSVCDGGLDPALKTRACHVTTAGVSSICDVLLAHVSTPLMTSPGHKMTLRCCHQIQWCCRHLVENDMGLFVWLPAKIIPPVIFHFPHILFTWTNICFVENWKHSATNASFLVKKDHKLVDDSSRTDI